MRIYTSCKEMDSEVKRDLHEMGLVVHPETMQDKDVAADPAFRTLELTPCDFMLLSGGDRDTWLIDRGCSFTWARAEFDERINQMSRLNPGFAWKERESVWKEFLETTGRFAYTYNVRMFDVLPIVLNELTARPNTRQAVMPIYDRTIDPHRGGGRHRVPCSMHYQFLRRAWGLDMCYVMRSSDYHTHFPYDIWLALELQDWMANKLGSAIGRFTFFTGSLHLYAKDADAGTF